MARVLVKDDFSPGRYAVSKSLSYLLLIGIITSLQQFLFSPRLTGHSQGAARWCWPGPAGQRRGNRRTEELEQEAGHQLAALPLTRLVRADVDN